MKETLTDANFPRTADGRVYHLGVRPGEVANRIITVGPPSRARSIARLLAPHPPPFVRESERGFLTITGVYAGAPVSVVAIGMGAPNMDFFVREVRECVEGEMAVVRLGSCGGLGDAPVGAVVVPRASVSVTRNYDFDFADPRAEGEAYRVSKPAHADPALHETVLRALCATQPADLAAPVLGDGVNASADSFYSSQGRHTAFPDHNAGLLAALTRSVAALASLEMETFHLLHLAASWGPAPAPAPAPDAAPEPEPVHHLPAVPSAADPGPAPADPGPAPTGPAPARPRIRAAAAQMVFAARASRAFITPAHVQAVELWTGRAVLAALAGFAIADEMLHPAEGSVWGAAGGEV